MVVSTPVAAARRRRRSIELLAAQRRWALRHNAVAPSLRVCAMQYAVSLDGCCCGWVLLWARCLQPRHKSKVTVTLADKHTQLPPPAAQQRNSACAHNSNRPATASLAWQLKPGVLLMKPQRSTSKLQGCAHAHARSSLQTRAALHQATTNPRCREMITMMGGGTARTCVDARWGARQCGVGKNRRASLLWRVPRAHASAPSSTQQNWQVTAMWSEG
jgi:hypothetical protein